MNRSLLVVDDHQMTRVGLRALAQAQSICDIDWLEAATLDDALRIYADAPAVDLVLLDLKLPDSLGLQGLRRFLADHPSARIALFSGTEDEFIVRQALAMGAVGFVPKTADGATVFAIIVSLLDARDEPAATRPPSEGPTAGALAQHRTDSLTATQLTVLELVLAGLSNQQIAGELGLAHGTVKNAVSAIMLKFDVRSRPHLISLFR